MHVLYHDRAQINENCFVAQLYEVLRDRFRIAATSLAELRDGDYAQPEGPALSLLKQRAWRRNIPFIAKYAEKADLYVYDQDPWEAYHDKASSPGVYEILADLVPLKQFLVTSGVWADYIREKGLPATFVRMGVLSRNCDTGPSERPIELGFQGTLHPHRKRFFERLSGQGLNVVCRPSMPYREFLKSVQDIEIFVHDEKTDIHINGEPFQHGLWIKDIEVAARGCFAIRNRDLDVGSYAIEELPAIRVYNDESEIPSIIAEIRGLPKNRKREIIRHTVNEIRRRNDWQTVVDSLLPD